jgi:hypothetical protein
MYSYSHNKSEAELRRENEILRNQVHDTEEERERKREQDRRDEEQRTQERKERMEEAARSASNWPEALRKQISLFNKEIRIEMKDPIPGEPAADPYFTSGVTACERAQVIWAEEEAKVQDAISVLQQQIQAIQDGMKKTVADRLEAEAPDGKEERIGWREVACAIREDNPESWLNW